MRRHLALLLFAALVAVLALTIDNPRHVVRVGVEQPRDLAQDEVFTADEDDLVQLYKRRGGGGGGGGRGGGGGGGGGGRSSGGGGSSSSRPANTRSDSNRGGTSPGGSGIKPSYGGGNYYAGGARVPYTPGQSRGGITPYPLAAGSLAFWPGLWLGGAYMYPMGYHHRYHNETSDKDEDREVLCGCAKEQVCTCEKNEDKEYYNSLLGNGSYAHLDKSVVNLARVNGTDRLLINGTVAKGTTANPASLSMNPIVALKTFGVWPFIGTVLVYALL